MPSLHGRKLACEIIKENFGDQVEKICNALINKGRLSLPELGRETAFTPIQLKNCLLVLIQHNCVQAIRTTPEETSGKIQTLYILLVDSVFHRLRFPKFLLLVRETFGEEAESLVEGLLEHGRLSIEQIIQRSVARSDKSQEEIENALKLKFSQLVKHHLVEHAPSPEPILHARIISDAAKKGLKGGKRGRASMESTNYFDSEEKRIAMAALPGDAERFRLPPTMTAGNQDQDQDSLMQSFGDSFSDINPMEAMSVGFGGSINKRKRDDDNINLAVGNTDEKDILWKVNYEEFIRLLRIRTISSMIRDNFDMNSSIIVSGMMEKSQQNEAHVQIRSTDPLSIESILECVRSMGEEGVVLTIDQIKSSLSQMCQNQNNIMSRTVEALGVLFSLNMYNIIQTMKLQEVENIITQRFGSSSCRIFRLLLTKNFLEQKEIGEMSMITTKEAKELLYKMLKEEFVLLQEISKAADHAPTRTYYLWRVNLPSVMVKVEDLICKAISNVRSRLAHELEQEQEVLSLLEQIQQVNITGTGQTVMLTSGQRAKLERIRKVAAVLETSLMNLDESLLLFTCF